MRFDLTIEPGKCPQDILSAVIADETITEYNIALEDISAYGSQLKWGSHDADLMWASRRAKGASFILTLCGGDPIVYRRVYRNGKVYTQHPIITWEDELSLA